MQEDVLSAGNSQRIGLSFFLPFLKRARNIAAATLYFLAAHLYDGLCCAISNIYPYPVALGIMIIVLFSVSTMLVIMHDQLRLYFRWDVLDINELNRLSRTDRLETIKISERFTRWLLQKGHGWIHLIGSLTIGPPIVTLLLRKQECWKANLFYLTSGTLISVLFWVTVWAGIGQLTLNRFIRPFAQTVTASWR